MGLPKTGTTLLQSTVFPQHPQVAYLGKRIGQPSEWSDPVVEKLVKLVQWF